MILIGRGLNLEGLSSNKDDYPVLSDLLEGSGSDSMMDTPVPIPNTEVKHHNGEDSPKGPQ